MSPERILSTLGNEHQRAVLDILTSESCGELEYDALVARVEERVGDEPEVRDADEHGHRLRIALHHNHLPKLKEAGIIDYETGTGPVQFVGGDSERELLALVESYESSE